MIMGVRKARCPSCKKLRRYETLATDRLAEGTL